MNRLDEDMKFSVAKFQKDTPSRFAFRKKQNSFPDFSDHPVLSVLASLDLVDTTRSQ